MDFANPPGVVRVLHVAINLNKTSSPAARVDYENALNDLTDRCMLEAFSVPSGK